MANHGVIQIYYTISIALLLFSTSSNLLFPNNVFFLKVHDLMLNYWS